MNQLYLTLITGILKVIGSLLTLVVSYFLLREFLISTYHNHKNWLVSPIVAILLAFLMVGVNWALWGHV